MLQNYEGTSSVMSGAEADAQSIQSQVPGSQLAPDKKAVVIGLYGLPGSGKTFLLKQLEEELGHEHFAFHEGSNLIAAVTPGGLDAFHTMDEQGKMSMRKLAIDTVSRTCVESGQAAVVAGHLMFWPEGDETGQPVYTQNDMNTFTHILYLDAPAELVVERREHDTARKPHV